MIFCGLYIGYFWGYGYSSSKKICGCCDKDPLDIGDDKRKEIFNEIAKSWDETIWWDEFWGRILLYRKKLVGKYVEGGKKHGRVRYGGMSKFVMAFAA